MRFTSTAHREDRWWIVQCDQYPGAISQVSRLDQAAGHQREAIAFVAQLDEGQVEVEVTPVLPEAVRTALDTARAERDESEELRRSAATHWQAAAKDLLDAGLTVRDIGTILGVSHQRAHQLVHSERARAS